MGGEPAAPGETFRRAIDARRVTGHGGGACTLLLRRVGDTVELLFHAVHETGAVHLRAGSAVGYRAAGGRAMTAVASPDLAAAMRLVNAVKRQGFRFECIALGPDGPLRGVRESLSWRDEIYVGGLWDGCHATRTRKCSLVVPQGLLVTERVSGDAIEVLHTVV